MAEGLRLCLTRAVEEKNQKFVCDLGPSSDEGDAPEAGRARHLARDEERRERHGAAAGEPDGVHLLHDVKGGVGEKQGAAVRVLAMGVRRARISPSPTCHSRVREKQKMHKGRWGGGRVARTSGRIHTTLKGLAAAYAVSQPDMVSSLVLSLTRCVGSVR